MDLRGKAPEEARFMLAEVLAAQGHNLGRYRDWLLLRPELPAIGISFYHDEAWHPSVTQADFRIILSKETIICESFGIVAATESELARAAVQRFRANSLHVVLTALCDDPSAAEVVESFNWVAADGSAWSAFLSGWQLTLYEGLRSDPPRTIFDTLEPLFKARLLGPKMHWFQLSLSTLGGTPSVEVLWDNEPWPEAEEAVRPLDWVTDNEQSARCFAIVRPTQT